MSELDEIKNRIHNRKGRSKEVNVDVVEVDKKYSKPSKLYKISMCCLILMAMFLSVAIYARKDEEGIILKDKFGININFSTFNKNLNIDNKIYDLYTNNSFYRIMFKLKNVKLKRVKE